MISCKNYDYVEIACTCRYSIQLTLKTGEVILCIGSDTALNDHREECIKVTVENENTERLVVLDEIETMEARVDNPHFKSVSLS